MDNKQINRWLRQQFSPLGCLLVGYCGIFNLLAIVATASDAAGQVLAGFLWDGFPGMVDENAVANNAWGYLAAIAVGLTILYAWKGAAFFTGPLIRRQNKMRPGTFLALLCLFVGAQLLNGVWVSLLEWGMNRLGGSVMDIYDSVSGTSDSLSMLLYVCLIAPVWEEILFRGVILRALEPCGRRFAVFASALLFGLFHGNLLQAPYAFLVGLVLGYAAAEYSIFWSIAIHMFNNLVLAEGMTRLLEILPPIAQTAVDLGMVLMGLAAVIVLIVNRRRIRQYRSQGMDHRALRCFLTSPGILALIVLMAISMAMTL